jgi:hypothetical protein
MTSVMILNCMDAHEACINDLASKVESRQFQPLNTVGDSVHSTPPLAASRPSNPAYSVHPTLQQFRADASLVTTAAQQMNSLEEAGLTCVVTQYSITQQGSDTEAGPHMLRQRKRVHCSGTMAARLCVRYW